MLFRSLVGGIGIMNIMLDGDGADAGDWDSPSVGSQAFEYCSTVLGRDVGANRWGRFAGGCGRPDVRTDFPCDPLGVGAGVPGVIATNDLDLGTENRAVVGSVVGGYFVGGGIAIWVVSGEASGGDESDRSLEA